MSRQKFFSPIKFVKHVIIDRNKAIKNGSTTPLPNEYPVNLLAKRLHPKTQYLKVESIVEHDNNCKSFNLVIDQESGTTELAYFASGQYLSISTQIDGKVFSRAYSISSSPKESLEGRYTLTIKRVDGGLLSNYILDNWGVGTKVEASAPCGNFSYVYLRDAKNVIGVAGGSGITPFLSFAKSLQNGDETFSLTLLYGSKDSNILFKSELDEIASTTPNFKVVYVLSDSNEEGYEHGFINEELIRKYAPKDETYSIFLCGPQAMYRFVDKEIEKLGLERKYVRHELFGEMHNPTTQEDYTKPNVDKVKITIHSKGEVREIEADVNDTILQSLEKAGIAAPNRCRSGECGFCRALLLKGNVYIPKTLEYRRFSDKHFNWIHNCSTYPLEDIEIELA